MLAQEMVSKAAENFSDNYAVTDILNNPVYYEDPEKTVNISIDDVNVKKQEETRTGKDNSEERRRKYVHNTVVHIGKGQESYTLNGYGMKTVLNYLIAFGPVPALGSTRARRHSGNLLSCTVLCPVVAFP